MTAASYHIAFDLGAESGRAMVGGFDGERIKLEQAARFPNVPVRVLNTLRWDVLRLFDDVKRALGQIERAHPRTVASLGMDTWGVDFALLGRDDELLSIPFHYRDVRTQGVIGKALERVPREEIFEQTGVQFMEINTLYQLLAMKLQGAPAIEQARTFLMIPDLFNFWLTGRKASEFTDATTTQFFNPRTRDWAYPLLSALDLPSDIFSPIVQPGTILGDLHPSVREETGAPEIPVIAPACHDTGSAVVAVPAEAPSHAWISSGTWSVLGVTLPQPVINATALEYNFTNEGGAGGTIRFCKNVMGLWIVQECRRAWSRHSEEKSYADLVEMARRAPPFRSLIDPDDQEFLRPGDMPARIVSYSVRTGQPAPEGEGMFVRAALESLAYKYRFQLERLVKLTNKPVETIHLIGGGSQNELLCQFTADATGCAVVAGPSEATALGNILVQMVAVGELSSLEQARELIRRSFELKRYEPRDTSAWEDNYERFRALIGA
jgi:rhamnulokinase